jgi:uncharacterized membrane protein YoaK (UPF0700 family)
MEDLVMSTGMTGQEATLPSAAPAAPAKAVGERGWAMATVLILNAATGVVEAVCFVHLGGVFASFVTGTVVLAGLKVGGVGSDVLIPYAVALAGFIAGAVLGGIFVGASGAAGAVARTLRGLAGEFALLVLAVIAYALMPHSGGLVTLGLLSAGTAVQFSATKSLRVADLGFTAATGLIHGMIHDFAARAPVRLPRKLLAILTLLAGACLGGLVSAESIPGALLIGSGLVAAAAVTLAAGSRRMRGLEDVLPPALRR